MINLPIGNEGLKFFGFNCLTGEACSYGMRLLFDVSERGKKHFEAYFGNTLTIREGTSWNSDFVERKGEERVKSVGSIMLPYNWSFDIYKQLIKFCALQEGYHVIYGYKEFYIHKDESKAKECWEEIERQSESGITIWENAYLKLNNNSSGRNTHQISGRID